MREVVDDDVGGDTVLFDQPCSFGAVDTCHRGARDTAVTETVLGIEPDLTAPGAHTDDLAKPQTPKSFRKCLAIGVRVLVYVYADMPAESVRLIPVRLTATVLPVHPILAQQSAQNEAVNVATAIVAHDDNQSLPIEDRIEITIPGSKVVGTHGPQVNVADLVAGHLLSVLPPRE